MIVIDSSILESKFQRIPESHRLPGIPANDRAILPDLVGRHRIIQLDRANDRVPVAIPGKDQLPVSYQSPSRV